MLDDRMILKCSNETLNYVKITYIILNVLNKNNSEVVFD